MFRFVIRKMISKKWMVLALLIGNILLISITAGNPMYTQAVLQRTLTKNLERYLTEKNAYPGLIQINLPNSNRSRAKIAEFDAHAASMPTRYGVPALEQIRYMSVISSKAELEMQRSDASKLQVSVSALTDLEEHARIVAGRMFENTPDADGVIDAIVSERALMEMNLLIDDVVTLPKLVDAEGKAMRVRIVGVFTNGAEDALYWVRTPSSFKDDCFISPAIFDAYFLDAEELKAYIDVNWFVALDYTAMRGDRAEAMLKVSQTVQDALNSKTRKAYRDNFTATLEAYLKTAKKVNVTLWILQAPIFALLAAFIFMVSRQMLEMEQNEIAVVKSRGAGKAQIFTMYLVQSVLISGIALCAGVPLGAYLCQVIGSSNAFLEFVRRSALPVEITRDALTYASLAAALSVAAMVLPAVRYAKTSIVSHKRGKNKRSETPAWQKLGLDIIVLGVALYGLYSFNGQKELLAARVLEGASLDPLLFLSSSLFMMGAGLFAVRVLPLFVWVIFRCFRGIWSPALYASFQRVLRTRSSQGFIMVFLIMTIALGVFDAQAARTINQNTEDNLYYTVGADVVVAEEWESNAAQVAEDPSMELMYQEPDFGRYEAIAGAQAVTKVYVNKNVTVSVSGGSVKNVQLMGIHTRAFGETAWFKDSLSDVHWYHYLNAMSQDSRGVLVSSNFRDKYRFKLGDTFSYKNKNGDSVRGVIYGFVDYFPSYAPVTYSLGSDGIYKETENYLIVAHLSQLQASWGITPYQIWLKSRAGSDYIYDFAQENGIRYTVFNDSAAKLIEKKNDPVLQGTNGILTVGFIVVLLLCSVGFLIYWILSIQSRSLQFGIFRAMGMSMREVITMLINEQIFISGLPIATGAAVGHLTARLYMPLIQLAYAASDNAVPLEVVSQSSDYIRLFVIIGVVILVCMVVLGCLISRMKIAQALKLGED